MMVAAKGASLLKCPQQEVDRATSTLRSRAGDRSRAAGPGNICHNPAPSFDLGDRSKDGSGRLVARHDVVGLTRLERDHSISVHVLIAGLDDGELLRRQCDPPRSLGERLYRYCTR